MLIKKQLRITGIRKYEKIPRYTKVTGDFFIKKDSLLRGCPFFRTEFQQPEQHRKYNIVFSSR